MLTGLAGKVCAATDPAKAKPANNDKVARSALRE
jgi:hypothetical protein